MKRCFYACVLVAFGCVAFVYAQNGATFRQLSDKWRQTEPGLERDAAAGGAQFEPRVNASLAAEKLYATERRAYFAQETKQAASVVDKLRAIDPSSTGPIAIRPESDKIANAASQVATRTAAGLANSKDAGVIRFRQAVDLERVALASVSAAIQSRQKASDSTARAATGLEGAQAIAIRAYQVIAGNADKSASAFALETQDWDAYYAALLTAGPATSSSTGLARPATPGVATVVPPASAAARNVIPPTRYAGDWSFPVAGLFHGPEPEKVEMSVQLVGGRLSGTLTAKFRVASNSPMDPNVKFEFGGTAVEGRMQTFALKTKEGAQGTIDLIPGRAFNLLEVNFQINPAQPGQLDENKISTANFVMLKQ